MNNSFSKQQLDACAEAITAYCAENTRYGILLAQMQSGKTETFLLIACEMLKRDKVTNVVIFSGNPEIELKEQLESRVSGADNSFWLKYETLCTKELVNNLHVLEMHYAEAKQLNLHTENIEHELEQMHNKINEKCAELRRFKYKIEIVWGAELPKYRVENTNTLFIWEEAHYAQSTNQRPDAFLRRTGIPANGDNGRLEQKNNYVLTVSATPFSEISDNVHFCQNKKIIKMKPGEGYNSVADIKRAENIIGFEDVSKTLAKTILHMNETSTKKCYAIIRTMAKHREDIINLCEKNDWLCVRYDSVVAGNDAVIGKNAWDGMNQGKEPEKHTIILICGMCRMGKTLNKTHLAFVMETSNTSNTDTVLQGLLGRVCGYGVYSVKVFLHDDIVQSGEIDTYIELWENDSGIVIPQKAMNVKKERAKRHRNPIIPLKMDVPENTYGIIGKCREFTINYVLEAFQTDKIVNKNDAEIYDETVEKYAYNMESCQKNIKLHWHNENYKIFNNSKLDEIRNAHDENIAKCFGSAAGSKEFETHLWIGETEIYITAYTSRESSQSLSQPAVPKTTLNEIFAHETEDGETVVGNGGLTIQLKPETAYDVNAMKTGLDHLISVAMANSTDRKITSNYDNALKKYVGIFVKPEVLTALQKNGEIFVHIKERFNAEIKCLGIGGKKIKYAMDNGFERLASISW